MSDIATAIDEAKAVILDGVVSNAAEDIVMFAPDTPLLEGIAAFTSFYESLLGIGAPSQGIAQKFHGAEGGVRKRIVGFQFDGLGKRLLGMEHSFPGDNPKRLAGLQCEVHCLQTFETPCPRSKLFPLDQLDCQFDEDGARDLVLHGEDVGVGAVVAFGPPVVLAAGVERREGSDHPCVSVPVFRQVWLCRLYCSDHYSKSLAQECHAAVLYRKLI